MSSSDVPATIGGWSRCYPGLSGRWDSLHVLEFWQISFVASLPPPRTAACTGDKEVRKKRWSLSEYEVR